MAEQHQHQHQHQQQHQHQHQQQLAEQQHAGVRWLQTALRDDRAPGAAAQAGSPTPVLEALQREGYCRPLELAALDAQALNSIIHRKAPGTVVGSLPHRESGWV